VLHHSDRGCHYASATYRQALAASGCIASMSRKGNCYGHATMESFWSALKHERVYRRTFMTRNEATTAIFDYIEGFYNRTRLHSDLGFKSPLGYESSLNHLTHQPLNSCPFYRGEPTLRCNADVCVY
jgi:transposase InsO family protein